MLYHNLCVIRTSIMNVIGNMYLDGKPRDLGRILRDVGTDFSTDDFMEELNALTYHELHDLGFEPIKYISGELNLYLFPAWLAPFVPEGEVLETVTGDKLIVGVDPIEVYADHWLNVGLRV